jgi:hypothetical protein
MKTTHLLLASAALASSFSANALVQGTLGGGAGTFAVLSSPTLGVPGSGGTLSGTTSATITGGAVFAADMSFADDVMPGENFLAAGPTPGGFGVLNTATLMFTTPVSYISFLWGSPDTYNTLTVISTGGGSQTFTATRRRLRRSVPRDQRRSIVHAIGSVPGALWKSDHVVGLHEHRGLV